MNGLVVKQKSGKIHWTRTIFVFRLLRNLVQVRSSDRYAKPKRSESGEHLKKRFCRIFAKKEQLFH